MQADSRVWVQAKVNLQKQLETWFSIMPFFWHHLLYFLRVDRLSPEQLFQRAGWEVKCSQLVRLVVFPFRIINQGYVKVLILTFKGKLFPPKCIVGMMLEMYGICMWGKYIKIYNKIYNKKLLKNVALKIKYLILEDLTELNYLPWNVCHFLLSNRICLSYDIPYFYIVHTILWLYDISWHSILWIVWHKILTSLLLFKTFYSSTFLTFFTFECNFIVLIYCILFSICLKSI